MGKKITFTGLFLDALGGSAKEIHRQLTIPMNPKKKGGKNKKGKSEHTHYHVNYFIGRPEKKWKKWKIK